MTWSAAVKPSVIGHDMAVYRAAGEAQTRIETAGCHVVRVRIDAELKGASAGADRAGAPDGGTPGGRVGVLPRRGGLGLPREEGQGPGAGVRVVLSRAAGSAVTVDYATSDRSAKTGRGGVLDTRTTRASRS